MRFVDNFTSQIDLFSVGVDTQTGKKYLSFPVNNGLVEYEEYYYIDDGIYNRIVDGLKDAQEFAKMCKKHERDNLLIVPPGSRRGEPVGGS